MFHVSPRPRVSSDAVMIGALRVSTRENSFILLFQAMTDDICLVFMNICISKMIKKCMFLIEIEY